MLNLVLDGEEVRLVTDDANAELVLLSDALSDAMIDPEMREWFDAADAPDFEAGVVVPEEKLDDMLEVIETLEVPGAMETVIALKDARKKSGELAS